MQVPGIFGLTRRQSASFSNVLIMPFQTQSLSREQWPGICHNRMDSPVIWKKTCNLMYFKVNVFHWTIHGLEQTVKWLTHSDCLLQNRIVHKEMVFSSLKFGNLVSCLMATQRISVAMYITQGRKEKNLIKRSWLLNHSMWTQNFFRFTIMQSGWKKICSHRLRGLRINPVWKMRMHRLSYEWIDEDWRMII